MPMPDRASPQPAGAEPAPERPAPAGAGPAAVKPEWQGSIGQIQLLLDGLDGTEIPLTAKLEQFRFNLPGDGGVLQVASVELHTDRLPGEHPLEALTQLKISQPSLSLPWRQDALERLPGGAALWQAVSLAEQAKLRAQVEDEVLEEIADPKKILFGSDFPFSQVGEKVIDDVLAGIAAFDGYDEKRRAMIEGALRFYEDLRDMGHIVYGALPPRRTPTISTGSLPRIFLLLEDVVSEELASRGVEVIDHRLWSLDSDGRLRPEFAHPDPADDVHGSDHCPVELVVA